MPSEVPEALVMEILSKLPVKSLTRFNCVYKATIWNPSTREFKILPPSSVQRPTYLGHTYACVYFNHGAFVFDSKADDYKFI
ncbi:hypothetical protein Goklo_005278 [Gossypium klotzschianum]|uniref:F-box domain-containing protein n=1 Tax=Gossypium klotzschianum TaxID=34286 RepID=A0A7J8VS15_9ROSI|nr:hypothetical protein [Gossypium klotzschianum]